MLGTVHVRVLPNLFRDEILDFHLPPLLTLGELLEATEVFLPEHLSVVCWLRDKKIERAHWHLVRPKAGALVLYAILPEDQRTAILVGGSLALAALAIAVPPLAVAGLGLTGTAGGLALGAGLSAGIMVGGGLLLNALVPPPSTGADEQQTFERVSIGSTSNRIQPYDPVPVVMGQRRVTPPLGARPYSEIRDGHLYSTYLFAVGAGWTEVGDLRFGDTPVFDFSDIEVITHNGTGEGPSSFAIESLYDRDRFENRLNIQLTFAESPYIRATPENTQEVTLNFFAPAGPYFVNSKGQTRWYEIAITIEYRQLGTVPWNVWIPMVGLGNDQPSPKWFSFTLPLNHGEWEIRVTRHSGDNNDPSQRNDEIMWFSMVSAQWVPFIGPLFDPNVALVAIRIRDQGSLGAFNCIAHSGSYVFEGGVWGSALTTNPASMFRRVLQQGGGHFFVQDADIDLAALGTWYTYCKNNGIEFSGVIETERPVREVLDMICARGRASFDYIDGKYTVIIDQPSALPVTALLTPRNVSGLTGTANYEPIPQVVRVRFADRDNNFEPDERLVYDDGFGEGTADFATAEVIDLVNSVVTTGQAFKEGRWFLAHRRLRRERFTCTVGLEHVMLRRGNKVLLQHWAALIGVAEARIKALTQAGTITAITLDQAVIMEAGNSYAVRIRSVATGSASFDAHQVNLAVGTTKLLTFTTPIALGSIALGDLVAFGKLNLVTSEMIVVARDPTVDGATVVLTHAAPGIDTAATGPIPAWNPNITTTGKRLSAPAMPQIISVTIEPLAVSGHPDVLRKITLVVHLARPAASKPLPQYINVRSRIVDSGSIWRIDTFPGDTLQCKIPTSRDDARYEIQAQAVAAQGGATLASSWSPVVTKFVQRVDVTPAVLATVHHLELLGQANDDVFTGRDPAFVWTLSSGVGGVSLDQITGGLNSFVDPTFGFYEVRIFSATERRIERVQEPGYTYYFSKNLEDSQKLGEAQPAAALRINVTLVDKFNHRSNTATLVVTNPAPAAPTGLSVIGGVGTVFVAIALPADGDFQGIIVWASSTSGFTPGPATEKARTAGGNIRASFAAVGPTFVRAAAYDTFRSDPGALNISSEVLVSPLDPNDISAQPTFQFADIIFTPVAASNLITWSAGTAIITQSDGAVIFEHINGGQAFYGGLRLFLYYQRAAGIIQATTDISQATGIDRTSVGIYGGGQAISDLTSTRMKYAAIDVLLAGTIGAGLLVTDHAIITQGAQIASAIINTAHIGFAQITNAHIQDLSVDSLKIRGRAVTTSRLDLEAATSARLAYTGGALGFSSGQQAFAQSVGVVSRGGTMTIDFACTIQTSVTGGVNLFLYRNGALIAQANSIISLTPTGGLPLLFFWADSPGFGEGTGLTYQVNLEGPNMTARNLQLRATAHR